MHIAIAGPIATEDIVQYLNVNTSIRNLPMGYAGAPLLATLIGELLNRGHKVSAFTTSTGIPISRSNWITAEGNQFKMHYIGLRPHSFRPKYGFLGRAMDLFSVERAALVAAMRSVKPDVVNAHWSYEFGLAAIESGTPHVITCHDAPNIILKYMPNAYRFIRYLMARQCLAKANVVTAVSPYLCEAVQKYCNTIVKLIPNPLPNIVFEPEIQQSNLNAKNKKPCRIAMVINGWSTPKNPEPALRAFMQLRASGLSELELHLFGADFGPGNTAERWCVAQGSTDGMFFHGRTPHRQLLDQLHTMDLMVHPALEESCPMGIAEALSLSLPVIGGESSGGVPWVIGEGGVHTNIRSSNAIASAIRNVLTNPIAYSEYATKALQSAQRFRAAVVADHYEMEYRCVLALA